MPPERPKAKSLGAKTCRGVSQAMDAGRWAAIPEDRPAERSPQEPETTSRAVCEAVFSSELEDERLSDDSPGPSPISEKRGAQRRLITKL